MSHSGDGSGWDVTAPANADDAADGAKEMRDLRIGIGTRLNREHDTLASSSAGGRHKAGSAKAYSTGTAPTQQPDAATSLASGDAGRLWVDTTGTTGSGASGGVGSLKRWTGSAWALCGATAWGNIESGDGAGGYGTTITFPFQPKAIIIQDRNGGTANGIQFVTRCSVSGVEEITVVCHKIIAGVVSAVTFIIYSSFTDKTLKMKIGTSSPGPDGVNLGFCALA